MCSPVEDGVPAEPDAGASQHEQDCGEGDDADVPRECGQGRVGESWDDAEPGMDGQSDGDDQEAKLDLDGSCDRVAVEPVGG